MTTKQNKINEMLQNIRRGAGLESASEPLIQIDSSPDDAEREPLIESSGETYGRPVSICFAGVGTCGVNILMSLKGNKLENGMVSFVGINSDGDSIRELENLGFHNNIALSMGDSYFLGAGGNLEYAKKLGQKYYEQFESRFKNVDLALVVTGMGGGTGTGVAPFVAKAAKEVQKDNRNALTIGVTTKPSCIEVGKRKLAEQGIEELRKYVDAIVVIDEFNILDVLEDENASADQADELIDSRFQTVLQSIMDTVMKYTKRNIDFADVCSILKDCNDAIITTVDVSSDNIDDTKKALDKAINDKLLIDHSKKVASRLLIYHFYEKGYPLKYHYEIVNEVKRLFGWARQQDGSYICELGNPNVVPIEKRGGASLEECKGKNIVIIMAGGFEDPLVKASEHPTQHIQAVQPQQHHQTQQQPAQQQYAPPAPQHYEPPRPAPPPRYAPPDYNALLQEYDKQHGGAPRQTQRTQRLPTPQVYQPPHIEQAAQQQIPPAPAEPAQEAKKPMSIEELIIGRASL